MGKKAKLLCFDGNATKKELSFEVKKGKAVIDGGSITWREVMQHATSYNFAPGIEKDDDAYWFAQDLLLEQALQGGHEPGIYSTDLQETLEQRTNVLKFVLYYNHGPASAALALSGLDKVWHLRSMYTYYRLYCVRRGIEPVEFGDEFRHHVFSALTAIVEASPNFESYKKAGTSTGTTTAKTAKKCSIKKGCGQYGVRG